MLREQLLPSDDFVRRHIGPSDEELAQMLTVLGLASLEQLIDEAVPAAIRAEVPLGVEEGGGEYAVLQRLRAMAAQNQIFRSFLGMGYYDCITPPVIQRNILENPGWYTQYTPYQAEISQGRLEALLNFQTMVADLTGLPLANASLLDEATAAAEAMAMCRAITRGKKAVFWVAEDCHPQTIAVLRTRAQPVGIELRVGSVAAAAELDLDDVFGMLVQYPTTDGHVVDYSELATRAHDAGVLLVVATDLLALTLLRPPGEFGADIAVGSSQRFGVPLGFGGPHAAFLATREVHKRQIPGRIIGVSRDADGAVALRMALQTREQHIRRDRATSNICTAQVLLAIMAGMYAVYHGPEGLRRIARRVHGWAVVLAEGLTRLGHRVRPGLFFDTIRVDPGTADSADNRVTQRIVAAAEARAINLRTYPDGSLGISVDEVTSAADIGDLWSCFAESVPFTVDALVGAIDATAVSYPAPFCRQSDFLSHPNFHRYHAEHELLRYLHRLQARDLSLTTSMIPLGSCTMKLNGTAEMLPVTWPEFGRLHPYAPASQSRGYQALFRDLETWLGELTGLPAVSLQPNSGAQGEYSGLLAIRKYHLDRGEEFRDVCLIPTSAHGTNPASAVMAGLRVVAVQCDDHGNIDVADLKAKAEAHKGRLAALMITYPSTHGVFEASVKEICAAVHACGGQVYMDGANLNAQVGLCRPGDYGADVCHLNLHKTFCIPHGGGGPGMGPIVAAAHLAQCLPGDPLATEPQAVGPVAAASHGSPSILPISWMYIALMGKRGLIRATQVAILNANYMAHRLKGHFDILYVGQNGRVAHEFIIDCRSFKKLAGVEVDDVAKRLMDFGFHAPTMSFPVPGTLMIEPTESESQAELDRFCDAMITIRSEIRAIEDGKADRENNVLKHAPHTARTIAADAWDRPYGREQAAFPAPWVRAHKYWPPVSRIDNAYGDRHLICTCPPLEDLAESM